MHRSAEIAEQIRDVALVSAVVGFAVCVAAFVRGGRRRVQPEPMVSSARATATSQP